MARIEFDLPENLLTHVDSYAHRAGETRDQFLRRIVEEESADAMVSCVRSWKSFWTGSSSTWVGNPPRSGSATTVTIATTSGSVRTAMPVDAVASRRGWTLVSTDIRDLVSKGLAITPDAAV